MNLLWLEKDGLRRSWHGRAADTAPERTASWIHLTSARLYGWCPQGPSHPWEREPDQKLLRKDFPKVRSLEKDPWAPCPESVSMLALLLKFPRKANWWWYLYCHQKGKDHGIQDLGNIQSQTLQPTWEAAEWNQPPQRGCAPGFLICRGAEPLLAILVCPASHIRFLLAQRKEGTHVIGRFSFRLDLLTPS